MRQKAMIVMLALAAVLLVRNLYNISVLPDESNQGQIFRIIFFLRKMSKEYVGTLPGKAKRNRPAYTAVCPCNERRTSI